MLRHQLRTLRDDLLEAFPEKNRLWVWRSKVWENDPQLLFQELEQLLELPLTSSQSAVIRKTAAVVLRLDDTVYGVAALQKLANSGLKSAISGRRRHQESKAKLERRNSEWRGRADEILERNASLSASAVAEILLRELRKQGKPPVSKDTLRKIITPTVKSRRAASLL